MVSVLSSFYTEESDTQKDRGMPKAGENDKMMTWTLSSKCYVMCSSLIHTKLTV